MQASESDLLDTTTAAAFLSVAPSTLVKWRAMWTGPTFVRVGRLVRYRFSDLVKFLASRTVTPHGMSSKG
jgi:hypothetical protein